MKLQALLSATTAVIAFAALAFAGGGTRPVLGNVLLQDTTPGIGQIGHANIKGTFKAGQVSVTSVNATIPVIGNNNATSISGIGGSFSSAGVSGIGLRGTATASTGYGLGVFGESRAPGGIGVYGLGTKSIGVLGEAKGPYGAGVWGRGNQAGSPGILAENTAFGGDAAWIYGNLLLRNGSPAKGFNSGGAEVMDYQPTSDGADFRVVATTSGTFTGLLARSTFSAVSVERNSFILAQMLVGADGIGRVNAQVKNFIQPDPDDLHRDIVYACVEGPEAAAYVRGTSKLVNGHARVALPRHFQNVSVPEGMTVQITPRSADSQGLAVVARSLTSFEVRELRNGQGSYEFDWEVKAVRRGFADYKVSRPWDETYPPGTDLGAAMEGRVAQAKKVYGIQYASPRP